MLQVNAAPTLFATAESYVRRGWHVIPVHFVTGPDNRCSCGRYPCNTENRHAGKHPGGPNGAAGWTKLRMSPADLYGMWHPNGGDGRPWNIGILTGSVSGIFVVDVEADGLGELADLQRRHGQLPITFMVRTGSGGLHLYFRIPAGMTVRGSIKKLTAHIDLRGEDNMVVAAGSRSGKGTYLVAQDEPVADAPVWLIKWLAANQAPTTESPLPVIEDLPVWSELDEHTRTRVGRYAEAALAGICKDYETAPRFAGNDALFIAACKAYELIQAPWNLLTEADARSGLERARVTRTETMSGHGQDLEEFGKTLASARSRVVGKGRPLPADPVEGLMFDPEDPFAVAVAVEIGPDGAIPELDDFWTARDSLTAIRRLARDRGVSPWATLGCVLAKVCSRIGPHVVLPPIVGGVASLNTFIALVGGSGGGKDAALAVSGDLLWLEDNVPTHEVGTGQGIDGSYTEQSKDGPVQFCDAALFTITEIDTLASHSKMAGATVMPTLRKLYSGSALGARYADKEKRRPVREHTYRAAVVAGVQPTRSGVLLNDADGGTPQRWLWLPTNDPGLESWVGQPVDPFPPAAGGGLWQGDQTIRAHGEMTHQDIKNGRKLPRQHRVEFKVCDAARELIVAHRRARLLAPLVGVEDNLNGHALLTRLKVAALLAVFDGARTEVRDDDWRLAGVVMAVSNATRGLCSGALHEVNSRANLARARAEIERTETIATDAEIKASTAIVNKLRSAGDWMTGAALRRAIRANHREHFEVVIDRLVLAGQVEQGATEHHDGFRYRART